ncbi:MAG: hypothetical protein JO210_01465 [Acidobacteriaceae bacterium]|nr:hypothetical protein [Acidobacteriaceae bacterium]
MNTKLTRYVCSAFVLTAVLAGAVPSFATTWIVTDTSDSPTDTNSLRYAITNAASGDTITFRLPNPSTITLTNGVLTISNNLTVTGPGAMQLAISGNNASQVLYINSGVNVAISGVTIENGSGSLGGGIYNAGMLTLSSSTLSSNSGLDAGGGIYNDTGTLKVTDSTFSGNSSAGICSGGAGGAITNDGGTVTVTNSTLSGNYAACNGGAIANFAGYSTGAVTLTNDTIVGNSAPSGQGGGIDNSSLLTIKSTLLAGNGSGGNCGNYSGTVTSAAYNLSDDGSCDGVLTQTTDINNTPAQLDPKGLQNNGGPTQTIALLSGSPAVDHIPAPNCTDPSGNRIITDQRGISRPQGPACDVGAYELIQTVPFSNFKAYLAIATGRHPGFVLASVFTLGSASTGLNPANETMTLQIANYTLSLPAGSFHPLWNAPNAPYTYEGTVNGATLLLGIVPLGKNEFQFDAAGLPVRFPGVKNPVTVSLSFGDNSGTTTVNALITQ